MKQSPEEPAYPLSIEGSDKYADLHMLQSVLLEPLAEALAMVIREKVQNGELQLGKQKTGGKQETD